MKAFIMACVAAVVIAVVGVVFSKAVMKIVGVKLPSAINCA